MKNMNSFEEVEEKIKQRMDRAIAEKVFSACVVGAIKADGERIVIPRGNFTYDSDSPQIGKDAIFDIASITKVIPVSSIALQLIDGGKISPDDKLIRFVPEMHCSDREKITIKNLLTQTLDFGFRLSDYKIRSADEILEAIYSAELKSEPGGKFAYSNATSILLSLAIERICREPLDVLAQRLFFDPLQMHRTMFRPLQRIKKEEMVPTEFQEWRGGEIRGEIHDESAWVLDKRIVPGSAGLFSTAPDLLNFIGMLLSGGSFNGKKYFSRKIITQMHTNQLASISGNAGLGWETDLANYIGNRCGIGIFGKTGFTGCIVICDMQKGIGYAILSNYTFPHRKADSEMINSVRRDIAKIILGNKH